MSDEHSKPPKPACKTCDSCDKARCAAFAQVAERKGEEFATNWMETRQTLKAAAASKNPFLIEESPAGAEKHEPSAE